MLLSLILGEQLLPDSFFGISSVVCELRYGETHKLVAHYKDADPETGLPSKTIQPGEMTVNSQQIFLQKSPGFSKMKNCKVQFLIRLRSFGQTTCLRLVISKLRA